MRLCCHIPAVAAGYSQVSLSKQLQQLPKHAVYKCILSGLNGQATLAATLQRFWPQRARTAGGQPGWTCCILLPAAPAASPTLDPAPAAAASKWQHVSTTTVGTTKQSWQCVWQGERRALWG